MRLVLECGVYSYFIFPSGIAMLEEIAAPAAVIMVGR